MHITIFKVPVYWSDKPVPNYYVDFWSMFQKNNPEETLVIAIGLNIFQFLTALKSIQNW